MRILFFIFILMEITASDLLIFSKNRPLQLATLLYSIKKHVRGVDTIYVLGKSTADKYRKGYDQVVSLFPEINIIWQKSDNDFFDLLTDIIFTRSQNDYIIFAVDDLIVQHEINLDICKKGMQLVQGYVFLFTLGKNITHMGFDKKIRQPILKHVLGDIFCWQVSKETEGSWIWVNQTDFAMYNKLEIKNDLIKLFFISNSLKRQHPQEFEGLWHSKVNRLGKIGLCYESSRVYNLALNRVCQSDCYSLDVDLDFLLKKFLEGYIIDIKQIERITKNAAHTKVVLPAFIKYSDIF